LRLLRRRRKQTTLAKFHFKPALFLVLALVLFWSPFTRAQRGAQTASADLGYLVQRAGTIVRGHVVSVTVEPHPQFSNLQTVVVTFSVAKVLKGTAAATYTFRQYLLDARDAVDTGGYRKAGELLLLLNPVSQYGLTSPVGQEQGRFRVIRDRKGNATAINGRSNIGLFEQLPSKAADRGVNFSRQAQAMMARPANEAPLESLEDAIATLVGAER
jgi:hypothetical protein